MAGERYSAGDKLPEPTGEMVQLSWGNFWTVLGEWLHWGVCIPPGNNLIFMPGMLIEEYLYTLLENIEIFGDTQLP